MQLLLKTNTTNSIDKLDVVEWRNHYPNTEIPDNVDLTDFGDWNIDGVYTEPSHIRRDISEGK